MRRHLLILLCSVAARAMADDEAHIVDTSTYSEASARAAAMTGAKPEKSLIEVIVVTGELESTTLKDTPHSVVVFTDEQLRRGTEQDMTALYQRVPNVMLNVVNGTPIIRGIARDGINIGTPGFLPTSGSYVDGYFTPSEPNLWDTRQAEVQRGPETFVSGGAMGGLDAVMTNDPTGAPNGRADVDWAPDSNDRVVGLAYGGPLTDTIGYRAAAYARTRNGFTTNVTRGDRDWDSSEDDLGRLKLVWRPHGDDATVLRVRAEDRKTTLPNGTIVAVSDPSYDPFDRSAFDGAVNRKQIELRSVYVEFDQRLDDRWRTDGYVAWIGLRLRGEADGDVTADNELVTRDHQDHDYRVAQMRAFFDDGPWQGFFRQYAMRLDFTQARTDALFPFDFDGPGPAPSATVQERYAYSTPDWWFIGTQLGVRRAVGRFSMGASLLRSGQLYHADRGVTSSHVGSTGDPEADAVYDFIVANFFPQAVVTGDVSDFNYLPTVDADYALTDAVTIGAKYERAARLAGTWFNSFRGTTNDYDDEISESYNAFVRSSAFDGRLTLRANLFYTRIRDQQVLASLSDAPGDSEILNAQRSHNDGLEIEATWTEGRLSAWLSVGLLETRLDRIEVGSVDFSGSDFPDAPPWTASLGFIYTHPRGLFVETDVSFMPQTRDRYDNAPWATSEGRQLLNGRIGWAFSKVEVSLYGRNLLDDEYLASHWANPQSAQQLYIPGDPREMGMTVSVAL